MTTSEFLSTGELAMRWHTTIRTLARWRDEKTGPAWVKLQGRVLYRLSDVLAYEADNTITTETT